VAEPVPRSPIGASDAPDLGKALNAAFADFSQHLGPYALGALILTAISVPIVFMLVIFGYVFLIVSMFGMYGVGVMGTLALAALLRALLGDVGAALGTFVGVIVTSVLSIAAPLLAFFLLISLATLPLAPIQASWWRAVAAHQRGETTLAVDHTLGTVAERPLASMAVTFLCTLLHLLGLCCCGVGVLVTNFLFGAAPMLVALGGLGPVEALRASARAALAQPNWHAMWTALAMGLRLASRYVPVLGTAAVTAIEVRVHRERFGDRAASPLALPG
jgi:hypothetical protein